MNIRKKRNELLVKSKHLREISNTIEGKKGFDLREKQIEIYQKWKFYDNYLKAAEKKA